MEHVLLAAADGSYGAYGGGGFALMFFGIVAVALGVGFWAVFKVMTLPSGRQRDALRAAEQGLEPPAAPLPEARVVPPRRVS